MLFVKRQSLTIQIEVLILLLAKALPFYIWNFKVQNGKKISLSSRLKWLQVVFL